MRIHVFKREEGQTHLGIMVTKAAGHAVRRNHARRRLRHILSDLLSETCPALDLVVFVNTDTCKLPFDALKRAAGELLERAGVLLK